MGYEGYFESCLKATKEKFNKVTEKGSGAKTYNKEYKELMNNLYKALRCGDISISFYNEISKKFEQFDYERYKERIKKYGKQ